LCFNKFYFGFDEIGRGPFFSSTNGTVIGYFGFDKKFIWNALLISNGAPLYSFEGPRMIRQRENNQRRFDWW
jgi:hypothetical protein